MTFDLFSQEMIDACTKSIINSLITVFAPLLPLFIGIIATCIIVKSIKFIAKKTTFDLSIVSGYSTRDAKKRAEFVGNIVDLLSAFKDIFGAKK